MFCPTCKGSGELALIPELRQPCPFCKGTDVGGRPGFVCGTCGGSRQVPVSEDKAFVAMVQWCARKGLIVTIGANIFVSSFSRDLGHSEKGSDANALADAITQAVAVEP